MGIEAAVRSKKLTPIDKISPSQAEKDMAALEVVKLHQLVITENRSENLMKNIKASEALDEESIDNAIACLVATTDDTVEEESWMNKKTSGYKAQKATKTVRDRVNQVEEFSKQEGAELCQAQPAKHKVFGSNRAIFFVLNC